jgi:signal transduction histidine kinase
MTGFSPAYVLRVGMLAVLYFAAAKLGLRFATVGAQVTFVWPPTGLALAALLLGGRRLWPGVALGAIAVNASTGVTVATACGMGLGNTLEALLGAGLLRRLAVEPSLARLRDVFALVVLAAGLSTIVGATIGVSSLLLGGVISQATAASAWGTWWLGDALGDVLVAPVLLVGAARSWRAIGWRRGGEAAVLLVAVMLGSVSVFGGWFGAASTYFSLVYLIFPCALWATLRFGPPGAVVFTSLVSSIAIWGVARETGPFTHGTVLRNNLLDTQVFLGVVAVMALILAASIAEREQVVARLQTLQAVSDTALAHLALTDLLPRLLDCITSALAVDNAAILLLNEQGDELVVHVARGSEASVAGSMKIPVGRGVAARIVATGAPLVIDDLAATEVVNPLLRESLRSLMGVPLMADGRVMGVMHVGSATPRHFTTDEVRMLRLVADRCALAINQAHLYEAERQAHARALAATEAREEFLSIAAHELKTPVTSVQGFAQLLLMYIARGEVRLDAPQVRSGLQHIEKQTGKLAALIGQLLDISRIDAGRLSIEQEVVNITSVVEGVVSIAQAQTDRHALVVDAPESLPAYIDPLRIEQALVNLVTNAIKFSPDGGRIEITVRLDAGTVQVAVRDHGLGIPPEHRAHIFDRFYQAHAHSHRSGMGLGLHISRQIIDRHGGSITAEFPADGGTRVIIRLPAATDDTRGPS